MVKFQEIAEVELEEDRNLDLVFFALSDGTRRAILSKLSDEDDLSVSKLAEPFHMSLPAVWKHLRVLEEAGLVHSKKNGRVKRCQLDASPMQEASEWIAHYRKFWEGRLDALAEYLENEIEKKKEKS